MYRKLSFYRSHTRCYLLHEVFFAWKLQNRVISPIVPRNVFGLRVLQKIFQKIFQHFEIILLTQFRTILQFLLVYFIYILHCTNYNNMGTIIMHLFCYFYTCKNCNFHRKFVSFVPGSQKKECFSTTACLLKLMLFIILLF
jgi:hypothetical protein